LKVGVFYGPSRLYWQYKNLDYTPQYTA